MNTDELLREWRKSLKIGDEVMHTRGEPNTGRVVGLDSFGSYDIEVKWSDESAPSPSYRVNLIPVCQRCAKR